MPLDRRLPSFSTPAALARLPITYASHTAASHIHLMSLTYAPPGIRTALGRCEVIIHVRRNFFVFLVKQLSISILVVVVGLCALFLHAADHTGDRVALILVSALIITTSFQTDIGLGPIQYLIWFDCERPRSTYAPP